VKRQARSTRQGQLPVPPNVAARETSADALAADELAADELRRRLRERGIVPIAPDDRIGALLLPGECVVAVRRAVSFECRTGSREGGKGLGVDLYVTTQRLVILGPVPVEYRLAEIQEIDIAAGAVRLVIERNRGVELGVPDPCVLRVEIAAVREAIRALTAWSASAPPKDRQGSFR
jgi:hypothetical protein